jgi:hypothetical protein
MATHDNAPDDEATGPGRHRSSFVAPAQPSSPAETTESAHHGAHSTHDDDELASALEAQVPATAAIPTTAAALPEIDGQALGWDDVDTAETGPQPTFSPWLNEGQTQPVEIPEPLPDPPSPVAATEIGDVVSEPAEPEEMGAPENAEANEAPAVPTSNEDSAPTEPAAPATEPVALPAAVVVADASAGDPGPVVESAGPEEAKETQEAQSFESLLGPIAVGSAGTGSFEDASVAAESEPIAPPVAGVWTATPGAYGRRTELEQAPSTAKWVWFTIIAVLLSLLLGVSIYGLGLGAIPSGIIAAVGIIVSFLPLLISSGSRRRAASR